jgi:hypothetical protein
VATKALAAFADALEEQGVTLPDRRYMAPGSIIPWDGEQLVVTLQSVGQGKPGAPQAQRYLPGSENFYAQFAVAIVRVVPALSDGPEGIPDEGELNDAGVVAMTDALALVRAAVTVHAASVATGLGMDFVVGPCTTVGPEGGLAGHRLLFEVSL